MVGFNPWLKSREVNSARAWRAMVPPRELHVMDMKAVKAVAQRFQMHPMKNEAQILFDLRVAGVVPIGQVRAAQLAENELKIALKRQFFDRLAVLGAQHYPARLRRFHELL